MLSRNGIVVYLRATVDELWHRTQHDRHRPLLQTANAHRKLAELYEERFGSRREARADWASRPDDVEDILRDSARRARAVAGEVMEAARAACGIVRAASL